MPKFGRIPTDIWRGLALAVTLTVGFRSIDWLIARKDESNHRRSDVREEIAARRERRKKRGPIPQSLKLSRQEMDDLRLEHAARLEDSGEAGQVQTAQQIRNEIEGRRLNPQRLNR